MFGTYARNVLAANGRYNPASNEELTPGPAAPVYKNGPRIRAVKIPLDGWVVQIWVEALLRWHTMSGSPVADNPDTVIAWGLEQVSGYPTA